MTQMDADRILSATPVEDDATVELSLRPRRLQHYIGQKKVKENLNISIEAAREHGTYQSIRKRVTLTDQPFTEELKGNVEIRSASIEYRRKGAAK